MGDVCCSACFNANRNSVFDGCLVAHAMHSGLSWWRSVLCARCNALWYIVVDECLSV